MLNNQEGREKQTWAQRLVRERQAVMHSLREQEIIENVLLKELQDYTRQKDVLETEGAAVPVQGVVVKKRLQLDLKEEQQDCQLNKELDAMHFNHYLEGT